MNVAKLLWLIPLFISPFVLSIKGSLGYMIVIPFLAIPAAITSMYCTTLRKKADLYKFQDDAKIPFIRGRIVRYIIGGLFAFLGAFVFPVWARYLSVIEIASLLILPIIYLMINYIIKKYLQNKLKSEFLKNSSIGATRILTTVIVSLLYPFIVYQLGGYSEQGALITFDKNYIANAVSSYINMQDAISGGIFSNFSSVWAYIILFFANGITFLFLLNYFLFFLLKKDDLLSVVRPLKDEPLSIGSAVMYGVFGGIGLLIYIMLFAGLQNFTKSDTGQNIINAGNDIATEWNDDKPIINKIRCSLEIINGISYKAGTIEQIEAETKEYSKNYIDKYYDTMIRNTDSFLDDYYSLLGQYKQIAKTIIGDAEEYMQELFIKHLTKDLPEYNINFSNPEFENILAKNKFYAKDCITIEETTFDEIELRTQNDIIADVTAKDDYHTLGPGFGAVSGSLIGMTMAKVTVSAGWKGATVLLTKFAIGTAAKPFGAAAGAAAGAAFGSFIPGIGTALGAVGGTIIGIIGGIGVDKAVTEADEYINREDFKKEIINAIEQARQEALNKLK